jgi:hypothetical protein
LFLLQWRTALKKCHLISTCRIPTVAADASDKYAKK